MKASDLLPSPRNWRRHPQAQADALRGVLAEIGYCDALLGRDTPEGVILIDGHLRAETTPDADVPVLILDVDEAEADKLLLTLDPLAALAEPDAVKLDELLRDVETSSEAVQRMLEQLAREAGCAFGQPGEIIEDQIPDPPDEAVTKAGDLIVLGNHRLLCGDSANAADVDRLLDGAEIHLVNTDPPYNVRVEPRSNNAIAAGLSSFQGTTHHQGLDVSRHPGKANATHRKLRAKDRPLANDFVSEQEFDRLLDAWFGNIARVLQPGRALYCWGGYANCANYPPFLKKHGLYFSQAIIWDKQHPVLTRKDFMGAHEWCFYCWREGAAHQYFGPNNATDLWHVKKVTPQNMVHLTEKPVELAARAIQYSSRSGENVLDLFGGSGSTLIACEETGRHAYLMELDPPYCDVIVQRWEQFTGKQVERRAA